jgi:hypothetical protein
LGNLSDPLSLAARLKRLIPRPVDVRRAILDAASTLAWIWPTAHKALRRELKRLSEEAPV